MDSNIARIVLSEALGDLSFAKFVEGGRRNELLKAGGYAAYISVLESFQDSIEKKGLLWSNGMWDGWSNLVTGAVAIGVMGERASPKELLGYALISAGIFLVGSNGSKKVR
jgi:multidrug transporter EmrE-like cation transporter